MYHRIVRALVTAGFISASRGDYRPMLRFCARDVVHTFPGDGPLGGTRQGVARLSEWFARTQRLFPGLAFTVHSVIVCGWPWDTRIAVEWTDQAVYPDGTEYRNRGVHIMRVRWFTIHSITAYLDTGPVSRTLAVLRSRGVAEADMPPIL